MPSPDASAGRNRGPTFPGRARPGGFTLVEMLVVIAIIVVIAALIVPALRGPLEGIQLSSAADSTVALLAQARQAAVTRGLPVEVRLYQVDDGTGAAWRMLGTVIPGGAGSSAQDEWISPPAVLAGGVLLVYDGTSQYSTVLTAAQAYQASAPAAPWKKTEPASAIPAVRNKDYVSFTYEPNGSTNLPEGSPWSLTLRGLHGQPLASAPAANYFALVIDPLTGQTLTYQP